MARRFTRKQLLDAAELGEGFCRKCGEQGGIGEVDDGPLAPCDSCGSLAMMPAQGILDVLKMVIEED